MLVRSLTLCAAGVAALVGCTADEPVDDGDPEIAGDDPIPSVTIPAARLTPFCQAMIDLSDRLETDPPDDTTTLIIETYESVADQVPDAIAVEFAAVLAGLRGEGGPTPDAEPEATTTAPPPPSTDETGGTVPPEGDDFFEEGYSPDDDPALRVNEYVEFACRDSVNNPGPPPTEPLDDIVVEETDA